MEAPKKIYVHEASVPELTEKLPYHIEYIRKEAFVEKAEKWLKEHVLEYTPELNFGVGKIDPDYYTKHFIEDFKSYMEE